MTYTIKDFKKLAVVQSKKEDDDDGSSGYVYTTGRNSTPATDVRSVFLNTSTGENSDLSRNTYRGINVCNQTRYIDTSTDQSTITEFCMGCLSRSNKKKQATHFCKTCDSHGRYICHTCIVEHNRWVGKNHDVVSLSVDRETGCAWQLEERREQAKPGKTDYHDIDSWFKESVLEDDCEYGELNEGDMDGELNEGEMDGELNEGDMDSVDVTRNSHVSDYTWANSCLDTEETSTISQPYHSHQDVYQHYDEDHYADYSLTKSDLDLMRRPRLPLPDAPCNRKPKQPLQVKYYEEQRNNSWTYSGLDAIERPSAPPSDDDCYIMHFGHENDSFENGDLENMRRPAIPPDYLKLDQSSDEHIYEDCGTKQKNSRKTERQKHKTPDNNWVLTSNRIPLDDGPGEAFNENDSENSYDLAGLNNESQNKVKYNPLRNKDKNCMLM